jgi:transposase InsO family protein
MKNNSINLTPGQWRLSIISNLFHPDKDGRTQEQRIAELAGKDWLTTDGTISQLSEETIRKWLSRFRAGGAAGLENTRTIIGPQIPDILGDAIIDLRNKNPHWSVQLILDEVLTKGIWNGIDPSKATIYRWCGAKGLLRSKNKKDLHGTAFEFSAFGALWISDHLHGPKVLVQGRKRKTYLLAIIDDASRFLVSARFHLSEGIESLITDLRDALIRFGRPRQFYTDNGAAFRSRILHQIGNRLDIGMPHTPAYKPCGRGKVERFFRTVRERFLAKNTAQTLPRLNLDLQKWMTEYHQSPHSGIEGETPLDKRLRIENICRVLPATANIDPLFSQSRLVRIYKDGTFRLQNQLFEAPKASAGSNRVEIFFLPWDLKTVYYGPERWPAKILDKVNNAHRFENKTQRKDEKPDE